jgi:putative signal transducing protein
MFCPECGAEFVDGVVTCYDCGVALVTDPPVPRKDEWLELVTVLSSNNPALIAVAKSLLEAADIHYATKGEGLQDLFGLGRIGTVNPITGPVEIQVSADSEREARTILAELDEKPRELSDGDADQ